jgi:hypothetical protein
MKHLGDFNTSTVVYGKFTTFRPSTGAAFTLAGTPALSVYKDNSTTQSTSGVTLTADFDSVTGLNHFAIDTSTDGTFYSSGSFFDIVITTGTVDGVSVVGTVVASFSIRRTSAASDGTSVLNRLPSALVSGRMDCSVGAMATDVLTSGALSAGAVTEIQSGLSTLDAAGVRSAIGLATANLDTQLSAIDDFIDTEVSAIKAKTDQLSFTVAGQVDATAASVSDKTGYRLSSTGVDDILDDAVDGSFTLRQLIRGMASALFAKLSGAASTSVVIRDVNDSKNRITATVDSDGNRSAVTLDLT